VERERHVAHGGDRLGATLESTGHAVEADDRCGGWRRGGHGRSITTKRRSEKQAKAKLAAALAAEAATDADDFDEDEFDEE
jgi:hypothetical protein